MKLNKYFIIIFMILLSINIFSYTSHTQWGNSEFDASGVSGSLATSLYPQYDTSLNFSLIPISDSSDYLPIVY